MSAETYVGGCQCGAVRYEATAPAQHACFCHCASCRRSAGATPVAWGTFATDRFRVTKGALAIHASSPPVARGFCSACGTALTYTHASRPGAIDVTLASLEEPERIAPERHIWVSDRVAWTPLADGFPQFSDWRSDG